MEKKETIDKELDAALQQHSGKRIKKTKYDVKIEFKVNEILNLGWKLEGKPIFLLRF